VLIKIGNTHVLCSASIEEGVPPWLRGQGQAGYGGIRTVATLDVDSHPARTHGASGRTQEIQRLIGRSLRAAIDLKTTWGAYDYARLRRAASGWRHAHRCNYGSVVALALAVEHLIKRRQIRASPL
jgi:ribonuclease PH